MDGRRARFGPDCWRGPTVRYGFAGGGTPTWTAAGQDSGRTVGVAWQWDKVLPAERRQHGRPAGEIWGGLLAQCGQWDMPDDFAVANLFL